MKWFPFILSILFFTLAIVPCSDGHTCEEEQIELTHDHSQDEDDHCSPLCFCTCCGMSYTIPSFKMKTLQTIIESFHSSYNYLYNYISLLPSSVWHPPTRI